MTVDCSTNRPSVLSILNRMLAVELDRPRRADDRTITARQRVTEELVSLRDTINAYYDLIRYLADSEPATRRLVENLLAAAEEDAKKLMATLKRLSETGD